ncbi:MAG TPA: response regulator [Gemmataceae bacterium]|jgi:DNA-binding response OmpR family regulator|nr:response regulator [Gemmataceae bacterium]
MHVLLLGAYKPLLRALKRGLEEEGCQVDDTYNDPPGNGESLPAGYDVIILDLIRPNDASLSMLQRWRWGGLQTHVLVLAPPPSTDATDGGLDAAADDRLTKPFELEELLARLRAVVCRTEQLRAPSGYRRNGFLMVGDR